MPPDGLTDKEVKDRENIGKVNSFESPVSRSYIDIVFKNFFTSFNLILLILGVALIYFQEYINAVAATGVILINVLISTIQEMKAKRRLDKIALLLRPTVKVVRNGTEMNVDPSKIVMDDVIRMESGDQAQVDGVILECRSFEMDESLLTGESSTRRKHEGDTIYSGAYCVTGECYYKVTALGEDTFASKMLSSAKKFEKKKTPLQRETATVTEMLMIIAFIYLALMVIINIISGKHAVDSLIQSVIILDIVPIALFLLITITYMIAAVRMADSGVLLQNSSSVESMSHVDTVCMDKTGTITTNNLVFEGADYFIDQDEAKNIIRAFVSVTGSKNHTIKAIEKEYGKVEAELIDEIQFSSERKFSAVRVRTSTGEYSLVLGAYPMLTSRIESDIDIGEMVSQLSKKGLRTVLLCKAKILELYENEVPAMSSLEPVALIYIRDEIRPDCREIIGKFIDNGMDLKVISGDDPETVNALFSQANIPGDRNIISGEQLDALQGDEKRDAVLRTNIFGRMKPDQKSEVIQILKDNGRYVAMVGDGVNDVKSIKMAHVGVALQSGSGATRGVADMVLIEDRFEALPKAIIEGKRTVTGMRDILRLYLTRNFVLAILVGVLLLIFHKLPLLPIQNTYYALVTVSLAAFLMIIWAKPSDNKEMILPGVLRFSIPMAVSIAMFGLVIYAIFMIGISNGWFPDINLTETWNAYHALFPDSTYSEFLDHMSGYKDTPDTLSTLAEVTARNAMLFFIVIAGILQLFLIYPVFGFMNRDGKSNRQILPILLAFLLLGIVVIFYNLPAVSVGLASIMYFPIQYYLAFVGFTAVWFVIAIIMNRSKHNSYMVKMTEKSFNRQLQKEIEKENKKKGQDDEKH
ncbi:MAG: HAD-IC family P-type ATPase [Candidatus Methanogranum gryphiswaldense]|nr:MAG: HAD-IC family P-type ATPase [Candidatus Methanogranum sp. U3.2.1]